MQGFRRALLVAVLFTVVLAATACGIGASPSASPVGTATTTTTTLPTPFRLGGTTPSGPFANLGAISRVAVVPLAARAITFAPGTLSVGGIFHATKIGYRQFGSGPDLLLISGEHSSMTWWDPQWLSTLAGHYTVTIFDPPGVGYSSGLTRNPTIASQADLVAGFINVLGITKPVVAGWGLGAVLALSVAERHPNLISQLVLIDPAGGGSSATLPSPAVAATLASPTVTMAELGSLYFPEAAAASRTQWLLSSSEVPTDVLVDPSIGMQAALQRVAYTHPGTAKGLRTLKVRTLVFAGALDKVAPSKNAITIAHAIPHAKLVVFENAGYAGLFQDSGRFIAQLEQFTQ